MIKFLASNGIYIVAEDDHLKVTATDDRVRYLLRDSTIALREFFLAERDAELGRWRSKEHPEYVVYPKHDGSVLVVLEGAGEGAYHYRVAVEYFAAHPERQPWHDAQPGEVWELTCDGLPQKFLRVKYHDERWLNIRTGIEATAPLKATAGRRIWPEEKNENS